MTRFLIVGDLHGAKPKIKVKDFDAIIAPGDFASSDKLRKYYYKVVEAYQKGDSDKDFDWYDLIGKRKARKIANESIKKGREVLEYLNSFGVPVFIVPGNADWVGYDDKWKFITENHYEKMKKGLKNIMDVEFRLASFEGIQFIGYGQCNGPELYEYRGYNIKFSKREISDNKKKYKEKIKALSKLMRASPTPIIFLSHNVPHNTKIDLITYKKSPQKGKHFGSLIAREIIEKFQPLICIGGHMHEHHAKVKIGKTVCVNAGFGKQVNTLLEIKDARIKKLEFFD